MTRPSHSWLHASAHEKDRLDVAKSSLAIFPSHKLAVSYQANKDNAPQCSKHRSTEHVSQVVYIVCRQAYVLRYARVIISAVDLQRQNTHNQEPGRPQAESTWVGSCRG